MTYRQPVALVASLVLAPVFLLNPAALRGAGGEHDKPVKKIYEVDRPLGLVGFTTDSQHLVYYVSSATKEKEQWKIELELILFDPVKGKEVQHSAPFRCDGGLGRSIFSPDGKLVVFSGDGAPVVWDLEQWKV